MSKQHDMWNHPYGTGLVFVRSPVTEGHYVIPELDNFRIPIKVLENQDDFLSTLLQVVKMKPRYEIIFHLILQYKNYKKPQEKQIGESFDGV